MRKVLFVFLGFLLFTSICNALENPKIELLAHRGLHQTFDPKGVTNKTCTASRIHKPIHQYIENTIPSIQVAKNLGADIIEFDIHPTIDGQFVLFHDWKLECRTNGQGVVREQTLKYLKSLDIGYGYTYDNGKTYPFRDKYIGSIPTLNEVLTTFPNTQFLINIKSNDKQEVQLLTTYLKKHNINRKNISVYGSGDNIELFGKLNSDIKTLSKKRAKSCIKSYILLGWSGYMPEACHNSYVPIPENYQWLIWGWPNKFEKRLKQVGSRSLLMGTHQKGKANSGIDSLENLKKVPKDYKGIIFTNRIDLIGKSLNHNKVLERKELP